MMTRGMAEGIMFPPEFNCIKGKVRKNRGEKGHIRGNTGRLTEKGLKRN
jgi:hypothetical protein